MTHSIKKSNSTNSEYHTFISGSKKIKIRLSDHTENFAQTDADYFLSLKDLENVESIAADILSNMKERKEIKTGDFINGVRYEGISYGLNSEYVNYSVIAEKKYPADQNRNNPNLIRIYFDENQKREIALVKGYRQISMRKSDFEREYNVICK